MITYEVAESLSIKVEIIRIQIVLCKDRDSACAYF